VACGVDFGALVLLDLLVRHPNLIAAAVLISPPHYALVPGAAEALSAERAELEEALRDAGPPGAVECWLARHAPGAPPERVARARQDHGAFFADFGGISSWYAGRRELRSIDRPVLIVEQPHASAHDREAAAALERLVPAARRRPGEDPVALVRELLS
jgi:pimeloyl-ACP methyl ester carboxylesterase